jgi:hypothetical protein
MSVETKERLVVIGWRLDRVQRQELLAQFPPAYANAVADHVTLKPDVPASTPLPKAHHAEIVGRVDDDKGVEAMVVRIDGTTDRPGGGTYHITWSLADGRRAKESNDAIAEHGWASLPEPIPIMIEPARF